MKRGPSPRLLAITDLELLTEQELMARVSELVALAVPNSVAILLRDHEAGARRRLELGRALRELTRGKQQFWVADRLDLALLLDADGVHLGERSVSAVEARRLLGPSRPISRAWHRSTSDADLAPELEALDALLLSPIFTGRKGRPPLGVAALIRLRAELARVAPTIDLFALGGVEPSNVGACEAAGVAGVAAIGAAFRGDAQALLHALHIAR